MGHHTSKILNDHRTYSHISPMVVQALFPIATSPSSPDGLLGLVAQYPYSLGSLGYGV